MLFTISRAGPAQDVRLFFTPEDAAKHGRVVAVMVHYDGSLDRTTCIGNLYDTCDRGWSAAAVYHPDGYLIVRKPIPAVLYSKLEVGTDAGVYAQAESSLA